VAEGLEKAVEEDLCLAFLVASDVGLRPGGEGGEFFGAGIGHDAWETGRSGRARQGFLRRSVSTE
jgi:hypothetical protein